MELDYRNFLGIIKIRKTQIEQEALENECLNNEFVRLTEMESSIRKILRDEFPKVKKEENE